MLETFRKGQRWWTAAVVVFVGGVFAVFIGLGGPLQSGSGEALIVVGDIRVGLDEYERARRQQIAYFERVLGDQFDSRKLGDDMIDGATIRLLVERARRHQSKKRGGEWNRVELSDGDLVSIGTPDQIVALDEALDLFAEEDPDATELVKLVIFGGFEVERAGQLLDMSRATAYRHWSYARAWLKTQLSEPQ